MTTEEAQEIAQRVAQEELGPRVYTEKTVGYDSDEVCVALPFPYFGAVSFEDLANKNPGQVERALRSLCSSIKVFIAAGIKEHDAKEQERMHRDNIARRLAGD